MWHGSKEARDASRALAQYGSLGFQLAAGTAFFAWGGWWLDQRLGWTPYGLAGGCLLGAVLGLYKLVRDCTREFADPGRDGE